MASKSKTYELALKIAGKVDSSLKKSCLAAAKDVNTLSASVQKVSGKAAKAMATATSAAITAITVDAAKRRSSLKALWPTLLRSLTDCAIKTVHSPKATTKCPTRC